MLKIKVALNRLLRKVMLMVCILKELESYRMMKNIDKLMILKRKKDILNKEKNHLQKKERLQFLQKFLTKKNLNNKNNDKKKIVMW